MAEKLNGGARRKPWHERRGKTPRVFASAVVVGLIPACRRRLFRCPANSGAIPQSYFPSSSISVAAATVTTATIIVTTAAITGGIILIGMAIAITAAGIGIIGGGHHGGGGGGGHAPIAPP